MKNMTDIIQQGVYLGSRGVDFKKLIKSVLNKGKINNKYIKILTDKDSMKIFSRAFTSDTVNENDNYQVLEQLGDLSGNKFIVMYMYKRFPQLKCCEGVKVVARLRINYGAKQSFSEISRKLNFWPYISATNEVRQRKMKPLLEDVFEAFLGAVESILDERTDTIGVGFAIVYSILAGIFDDINISLRYEDLYDAKTRLKELFDIHETSLGPLVYKESKNEIVTVSTIFRVKGGTYQEKSNGTLNRKHIIGGEYVKIGEGIASLKADAQQNAAIMALKNLNDQGWCKPIPLVYQRFNSDKEKNEFVITADIIKKLWGDDINALQNTKEKTKYQSKYQSTPLSLYCRTRNIKGVEECLKKGADCNILDTEGMYPMDVLFIGNIEEDVVKQTMMLLESYNQHMNMHYDVFEMYYTKYLDKYFNDRVSSIKTIK